MNRKVLIIIATIVLALGLMYTFLNDAGATEEVEPWYICHAEPVDGIMVKYYEKLELPRAEAERHLNSHPKDVGIPPWKDCGLGEPTPTPTPEPTPTERPEKDFELGGAPVCTDNGVEFAPTITRLIRDETGKNVDTRWTETDTEDFIVYYGPTGQELVWNTGRIQGHSTVLHLEQSQMIDAIVCSVSPCGEEKCGVRVIDP
jgi:hypothetical protein